MRKKVEEELQRLEQDHIIEPVKYSDWAAPTVPVLKPNGQVRICGDYKVTVKKASKLEQDPIPNLEDLITKLGNGSVYHKLDLSHAYSQIQLEPESRTFVTITPTKVCSSTNASPLVFPVHQLSSRGLWSPCLLCTLMTFW